MKPGDFNKQLGKTTVGAPAGTPNKLSSLRASVAPQGGQLIMN